MRIVLAAALVLAAWLSRGSGIFRPEYWLALVAAHPVAAPALFVPAYSLAVTLLLPTLPLNLAAGAMWGPYLGSVLALAGSVGGAILAFGVARGAFGRILATKVDVRMLSWIQEQFERHDWKIVAFVRLNPIFPGPVNFLFGFTSMAFRTYVWATLVFVLPPTAAFATLGHALGRVLLYGYADDLRKMLYIVGACVLFLVASAILLRMAIRARQNADALAAVPPAGAVNPDE